MKSKSKCFDGFILNYEFMGLHNRLSTCFGPCPLRAGAGRREQAVGMCTRGRLRRGELITRGEGRCLAGWADAPYLRDWLQARSPGPGVRTTQRAGLFSDRLALGEENQRQVFVCPGPASQYNYRVQWRVFPLLWAKMCPLSPQIYMLKP